MKGGAPELVVERGCVDDAVLVAALGAGGFTVSVRGHAVPNRCGARGWTRSTGGCIAPGWSWSRSR